MARAAQGAVIVMRQYGGPEVLRLESVPLPALQADEIRIHTIASAINHSDLEIRAGNWPILRPNPFPYTPGLEVVGDVLETGKNVSEIRVDDRVITMMQGLGGVRAERPGGYAEYVVVRASAVATFARDVDPLEMAALGLASVTAFEGLRKGWRSQEQPHRRHRCSWGRWLGRCCPSECGRRGGHRHHFPSRACRIRSFSRSGDDNHLTGYRNRRTLTGDD